MRHTLEILKQKLLVGIGSFFTGILSEADITAAILRERLRQRPERAELPTTIVHADGDGMGVCLSSARCRQKLAQHGKTARVLTGG